jgi:DNA-binding transcriptional ArsR family regulator
VNATAVDAALAALAEPTRRAVVELLRHGPRRAGELAEALAMSPPALSRHLRVLKASGLLADDEPEHDARVRLYRLQPEGFEALGHWVDDVRGLWADQLAAFQAHVEQRALAAAPAPAPAAARRTRR